GRHHPLSAPARLYRARLCACPFARPHRQIGRQGTGAGARSQGLRRVRQGSRMNIAVNKTPAELAYDGMLLPHPRLEDWKWTNLRVLIDRPYPPRVKVKAEAKDVERLLKRDPLAKIAHARIVFVNGAFDKALSNLPTGGSVRATPHLAS